MRALVPLERLRVTGRPGGSVAAGSLPTRLGPVGGSCTRGWTQLGERSIAIARIVPLRLPVRDTACAQRARRHHVGVFGEVVKELRLAKGISQSEAEKRAGMSHGHWSKIESGQRDNPRLETIWRVAGALDLTASELLRRVIAEQD